MGITIDESTRIILASQISLGKGVRKKPADFARETFLILDNLGHPVATIRPLSGAAERTPPPPQEAPSENGEARSGGRLSDAQIESLERLWATSPGRTPEWIVAEFARRFNRTISVNVATKYAPAEVVERLAKRA